MRSFYFNENLPFFMDSANFCNNKSGKENNNNMFAFDSLRRDTFSIELIALARQSHRFQNTIQRKVCTHLFKQVCVLTAMN